MPNEPDAGSEELPAQMDVSDLDTVHGVACRTLRRVAEQLADASLLLHRQRHACLADSVRSMVALRERIKDEADKLSACMQCDGCERSDCAYKKQQLYALQEESIY